MSKFKENTPRPLPNGLHPVNELLPVMLPSFIRNIVFDVAERINCRPDFPYASVIMCLSAMLATIVKIFPKQYDEGWKVTPNLGGAAVGTPASKKSPGIDSIKDIVKAFLKDLDLNNIRFFDSVTYQGITKHLEEMGDGIAVIWPDELTGFFKTLSASTQDEAASFYLSALDGNSDFTTARGCAEERTVDNSRASVFGGIPPDAFKIIITDMLKNGGNTGLVGRLLLLIYPDLPEMGLGVDRPVDEDARNQFLNILTYITELDSCQVHFTLEAQKVFNDWCNARTAGRDIEDILLATSYEKAAPFVCSLALVFQVAISAELNEPLDSIGQDALEYALVNYDHIWEHTIRVLGSYRVAATKAANVLLTRLEEGRVPMRENDLEIDSRRVSQFQWSGLRNKAEVEAALGILEQYGHVKCVGNSLPPKFEIHPNYYHAYQGAPLPT